MGWGELTRTILMCRLFARDEFYVWTEVVGASSGFWSRTEVCLGFIEIPTHEISIVKIPNSTPPMIESVVGMRIVGFFFSSPFWVSGVYFYTWTTDYGRLIAPSRVHLCWWSIGSFSYQQRIVKGASFVWADICIGKEHGDCPCQTIGKREMNLDIGD